MRNALRIVALLLLGYAAYAYYQMSSESEKLPANINSMLSDPDAFVTSHIGGAIHSDPQRLVDEAGNVNPPPPKPVAAPPPAPPELKSDVPEIDTFSGPAKTWELPQIMPAQPNWTWTTMDGTTYQDVVVTDITSDEVAISHSMGAARIPISSLPRSIRKVLGYDPAAAATASAESDREAAHPYYLYAARNEAQAVAVKKRWPLAWEFGFTTDMKASSPVPGGEADATQMVVNVLKSQAIVIFSNGTDDFANLPSILHDQLYNLDDGVLQGGHHYLVPKVIFTNPSLTKTFGRVSYTQMKANGESAFDQVLAALPRDSSQPSTVTASSTSETAQPVTTSVATASTPDVAPAPTPTPASPPATNAAPTEATDAYGSTQALPAQPNWTWTTSDGTSYSNVVVTSIDGDTVTISHSLGVAHIPIYMLSPDIQKRIKPAAKSPQP